MNQKHIHFQDKHKQREAAWLQSAGIRKRNMVANATL